MAKNDRPLEVRPVITYRVPKYPSPADPDPTRYPRRIPFPFRRELLSAVAAIGTSGCIAEMPGELEIHPLNPEPKPAPSAEIKPRGLAAMNPFPLSRAGLPHHTSPYGTGQPAYMIEKTAREVIERVFQEEGFALEGPIAYEREGVAFVADGYDANARVGYVFGSWKELDKDALRSWHDKQPTPTAEANDPAKISLGEIEALETYAANGEAFIAFISQFDRRFVSDRDDNEELRSELQTAAQIEDPELRSERFRELYDRAARAALQRLEEAVRSYLAWARTQGL